MNFINPSSPIVAGVDGSTDGIEAANFAANLATAQGRSLMLLHAYRRSPAINPLLPLADIQSVEFATTTVDDNAFAPNYNLELMREAGERALNEAEQHVHRTHPDLRIIRNLVKGAAPKALIRASREAAAVVVARNRERAVERFFSGSTSSALAAHTTCPVVIVPSNWAQLQRHQRLVVGVDGSSSEYEALAFAFQQASRTGSELIVVHSWQPQNRWYWEIPELAAAMSRLAQDDSRAVSETLAGWSELFPDVKIDTVISDLPPAEALVRASDTADMVVVSARGRGGFRGLPIGSTARTVIAHAACLTVVVRRGPQSGHDISQPTSVGTEFVAPFY